MQIDLNQLEIRPIEPNDDVTKLDCTKKDGSDPLKVDDYVKSKARRYHNGKASTVYIVKQGQKIVAFFALSMTSIEKEELEKTDKLGGFVYRDYPAVHLGQMGIDKQYRRHGLGQIICKFCVGLAIAISEQIACRYITLMTTQCNVGYYEKWGFKQSVRKNSNEKIGMYKRLTPEVVVVNENVNITESVIVVLRKSDDREANKENKGNNQEP
jgi:hypothetical protein